MTLYSFFNTIATLSVLGFNLWRWTEQKDILGARSRKMLEKGKPFSDIRIYGFVEMFALSFFQYYLPGYFNRPVGNLLNTGANYFGLILTAPVFLLAICWLLKVDFLRGVDMITPAYPLALAFSKIACFAADCCCGIACGFGIYNAGNGLREFPVQLLESATALVIFIFLLSKEGKFKTGTVFPVYLMLYSGSRFFTEFLRVEPAVFFGLKTYHLLCILGVLVGAVEYILVQKWKVHVMSVTKE